MELILEPGQELNISFKGKAESFRVYQLKEDGRIAIAYFNGSRFKRIV